MQPHQIRVIHERDELNTKLTNLSAFMESSYYTKLDSAEQDRLTKQALIMIQYRDILSERIAAFS